MTKSGKQPRQSATEHQDGGNTGSGCTEQLAWTVQTGNVMAFFTWREADPRGGQHCRTHECSAVDWLRLPFVQSPSGFPVYGRSLSLGKRGSSRFSDGQTDRQKLLCDATRVGLFICLSVILIPSEAEAPASSVPRKKRPKFNHSAGFWSFICSRNADSDRDALPSVRYIRRLVAFGGHRCHYRILNHPLLDV